MLKYYVIIFISINSYSFTKINLVELVELDVMLKLGLLNKFYISAETKFDERAAYKEDGTAGDYEGKGWGVKYSNLLRNTKFSSVRFRPVRKKINNKIILRGKPYKVKKANRLVSSGSISIDCATYSHCSCDGASTNANWYDSIRLKGGELRKRLADIDPVIKSIKDDLDLKKSIFYRSCLIKQLGKNKSAIYIDDDKSEEFLCVRNQELYKLALSDCVGILETLPYDTLSINSKIKDYKASFNNRRNMQN